MGRDVQSYEKFHYALRPSKQVERKLLIETLHYLGHNAGYSLMGYTYLGFGSVYYTDFILLHKYLYVNHMICIEGSDIPKRMRFNRPYRFVNLQMGKVSKILPRIDFRIKYIVWLDYDYGIDYGYMEEETSILDDVSAFVSKLSPGSLFIVTSEAEPRISNRKLNDRLSEEQRVVALLDSLNRNCSNLFYPPFKKGDITKKGMPLIVTKALREQITKSVLSNPQGLYFHQLFNFVYADGRQMVTVGGILDFPEKRQILKRSGVFRQPCITTGAKPKEISVPPLTIREKEAIDAQIEEKCEPAKIKLEFELKRKLLRNYLKYYKHYPSFHESIL